MSIILDGTNGITFPAGGLANPAGNISGSNITGTLTTAEQPNVTSVGTLSALSVAGNINAGNITGTLTTAAQPNITSVGTLGALSVTGNVTAGNLLGTIGTAAQTNITSVGTLSSLSVGIAPSAAVLNSLQYTRVGRRHIASGGLSGATWINTGITFTPSNSYCFVLVDALGNENGRNNGFRRYIVFYNIYSGWATTGAIINNQHGNDYGLVDVRYTSTLEVKAANNVSGGPYFIYATEYLL